MVKRPKAVERVTMTFTELQRRMAEVRAEWKANPLVRK